MCTVRRAAGFLNYSLGQNSSGKCDTTRHYKILIPQFLRDKRLESLYNAPPFNSIDIVWERMSNDVEAGICPKSFVQNC